MRKFATVSRRLLSAFVVLAAVTAVSGCAVYVGPPHGGYWHYR